MHPDVISDAVIEAVKAVPNVAMKAEPKCVSEATPQVIFDVKHYVVVKALDKCLIHAIHVFQSIVLRLNARHTGHSVSVLSLR